MALPVGGGSLCRSMRVAVSRWTWSSWRLCRRRLSIVSVICPWLCGPGGSCGAGEKSKLSHSIMSSRLSRIPPSESGEGATRVLYLMTIRRPIRWPLTSHLHTILVAIPSDNSKLTMFHQGDLQSGISAAIQEQKLVACFIRQGTIGFPEVYFYVVWI